MPLLRKLHSDGLNVGFHFDVQIDDKDTTSMIAGFSQGGLGLPERDYYFRDDKDAKETRAAYVKHIARTLELAGDKPEAAKADGRRDHGLRDQAGEGLADTGGSPRSGEELQQVSASRDAQDGPRHRLGRLLRRRSTSRPARRTCWCGSRNSSRPSTAC